MKLKHAAIVCGVLRGMLGYVGRLRDRMYATGFVDEDSLMQVVLAAHDALHRLTVRLHYDSGDKDDTS
jgi:hypothetical protein